MHNSQKTFQCRGKLFITGEYAVLKGALSLVVPVQYTQQLNIIQGVEGQLHWTTTYDETTFLSATFRLSDFQIISCSDSMRAAFLKKLFTNVRRLNGQFLQSGGYKVRSDMGANPAWGFGSSAQLTVNVARWAEVDPIELHKLISTGSGADVACSLAGHAIHYSILMKQSCYNRVTFNPPFANQLLLVYSNRKQDSTTSVNNFLLKHHMVGSVIDSFSQITREVTTCSDIKTFASLLSSHETLLKSVLKQPTVQETLFADFPGTIKSLGAWGGDFLLAVPEIEVADAASWFIDRGYPTILPFPETILLDS